MSLKLCKNCIHFKPGAIAPEGYNWGRCALAANHATYLVTGRASDITFNYAQTQRMAGAPCGPDGLLYTPRSLDSRVLEFTESHGETPDLGDGDD